MPNTTAATVPSDLPPLPVAVVDGSEGRAKLPRLRLGPKCRLRTRAHLEGVRQHGSKEAMRLCVVSALQPPPDGARRVAFVVSRRYSLQAVVRNRARRLLREAYRQTAPALRPAWLVLIPRVRLQRARMQEVLADLRLACARLGLLL